MLEVRKVWTSYGAVNAVMGASIEIGKDESVLLLGANGAGKTSLLKTIVGIKRCDKGQIYWDSREITDWRANKRRQLGMVYMSELGVFPTLTVRENLEMGAFWLTRREARESIELMLRRIPELSGLTKKRAASFSGGQRKILGLAKALVGRPKLLVLDEPSAGLAPIFVKRMIEMLKEVKKQGMTMLIAEQNASFIELGDRGYVLGGGEVVVEGTRTELEGNDVVRNAYFRR